MPCSSSSASGSPTRARPRWRPSRTAACSCRPASTLPTAPSTTSSSGASPRPERQVRCGGCLEPPPLHQGSAKSSCYAVVTLFFGKISSVDLCRWGSLVWGFALGGRGCAVGLGFPRRRLCRSLLQTPSSFPTSPDPQVTHTLLPSQSDAHPFVSPGPAQCGRAMKSLPGLPIAGNSI